MPEDNFEAIIWCPDCDVEKWLVTRKRIGSTGVYANQLNVIDGTDPKDGHLVCSTCRKSLERKTDA